MLIYEGVSKSSGLSR